MVAATFGALHLQDEGFFVYVAMLPTLLPSGSPQILICGESGAHPSIYSQNVVLAHRRG